MITLLQKAVRGVLFEQEQTLLQDSEWHSNVFFSIDYEPNRPQAPLFGLFPEQITDLLLLQYTHQAKIIPVVVRRELWPFVTADHDLDLRSLTGKTQAILDQENYPYICKLTNVLNCQILETNNFRGYPNNRLRDQETCQLSFHHNNSPQDSCHLLFYFFTTDNVQTIYPQPIQCRQGTENRECLPTQGQTATIHKISEKIYSPKKPKNLQQTISVFRRLLMLQFANSKHFSVWLSANLDSLMPQILAVLAEPKSAQTLQELCEEENLDHKELRLEEIYEVTKKFEQRNFIANGNILVFIFSCLKSLIKERRAFEILKYLIKLMMNSYFAATLIDQLEQPNLENSGHRLVREIGTKVTGIDSSLFFSETVHLENPFECLDLTEEAVFLDEDLFEIRTLSQLLTTGGRSTCWLY